MNDFKFVYVTGLNLNLGGISHTWIMKIKTKLKSKGAFLLSSVFFFKCFAEEQRRSGTLSNIKDKGFEYAPEDYC